MSLLAKFKKRHVGITIPIKGYFACIRASVKTNLVSDSVEQSGHRGEQGGSEHL